MTDLFPEDQLDEFIAKFSPETAARVRAILAKMRQRLPGAVELVYDNYNALAIGFGPTERTSDAAFSIAVFPRWISLFFMHGASLSDPQGLLKGRGKLARHIVLDRPETLDLPPVRALMAEELKRSRTPIDPTSPARIVIKSISQRRRPRRPR